MPDLLRVEVERRGDAASVALSGELDISTVRSVRRELDKLLRRSSIRRLCIDLRGLEFMDSTGISLLLHLAAGSQNDGYELAVVKGPPAVHRALELTGIDGKLALVESPEEAGFALTGP